MKMIQDKFVVAIKANGKVLRETKDLVLLPYGSEFTVLVKNLNSRRAKFRLHIDGTDVLDGQDIIVNGNSEVEMKRFIRNGNMDEGNAFKFIERTQAIEDGPRGIKVDDGVVRVEFWFEKAPPEHVTTIHHHYDRWPYFGPQYDRYGRYGAVGSASNSLESSVMRGIGSTEYSAKASASAGQVSINTAVSDVGITVPGSKVEQKFTTVYGFNAEESSNVIILRIAGVYGDITVTVPVVVRTKNICTTCDHTNKQTSKFCSECGTSLTLI